MLQPIFAQLHIQMLFCFTTLCSEKKERFMDTDTLTYTQHTTRCVFCACLFSLCLLFNVLFRFQFPFHYCTHTHTFRPSPSNVFLGPNEMNTNTHTVGTYVRILRHTQLQTKINRCCYFFFPSLAPLVSMTTIRIVLCDEVEGVDGEWDRERERDREEKCMLYVQ